MAYDADHAHSTHLISSPDNDLTYNYNNYNQYHSPSRPIKAKKYQEYDADKFYHFREPDTNKNWMQLSRVRVTPHPVPLPEASPAFNRPQYPPRLPTVPDMTEDQRDQALHDILRIIQEQQESSPIRESAAPLPGPDSDDEEEDENYGEHSTNKGKKVVAPSNITTLNKNKPQTQVQGKWYPSSISDILKGYFSKKIHEFSQQ